MPIRKTLSCHEVCFASQDDDPQFRLELRERPSINGNPLSNRINPALTPTLAEQSGQIGASNEEGAFQTGRVAEFQILVSMPVPQSPRTSVFVGSRIQAFEGDRFWGA